MKKLIALVTLVTLVASCSDSTLKTVTTAVAAVQATNQSFVTFVTTENSVGAINDTDSAKMLGLAVKIGAGVQVATDTLANVKAIGPGQKVQLLGVANGLVGEIDEMLPTFANISPTERAKVEGIVLGVRISLVAIQAALTQ